MLDKICQNILYFWINWVFLYLNMFKDKSAKTDPEVGAGLCLAI